MLLVKQKITRTLKKSYRPMVKLLQIKSLLPMNSINTLSDLDSSLHSYDNLVPANERSMFMRPSSPAEIGNVITQLSNKNNSTKLPLKFLKYVKYEIATILCKLFNLCVDRGIYPESLERAKVIRLCKTGNVGSVANYRPISLLPLLNKFEKLLYVGLNNFLESYNIISQNQFGFCEAKDTQRATLKLLDSILPAMSSKKCFGCVFLDFHFFVDNG